MKSLQNYLLIVIRRAFCSLFAIIVMVFSAHAQNVAIKADKTSDCPPFPVNFTATLDNGYQSVVWDFGVGANVTGNLTPSKIFQTPGTYHVKFTATYPGNIIIVKQIDITVYNKPIVSFTTTATTGCIPYTTTFTDNSKPGDGTIQDITWDFGDGGGATGANVTHVYTQPGTYNVISVVTNSMSPTCKSPSEPFPVKVQDAPQPGFAADKTQSCTVPFDVQFFNTTVNNTSDALTYLWDYGDGTTGSINTHTYTKEGKYTVILTAITSGKCQKQEIKKDYIIIQKIKPDFTATNLCAAQNINFKNTTQPIPDKVLWTFPDGSTSTNIDAAKQFPATGDYLIKMQAWLGNCTAETQQTIHVNPTPTIDLSANPLSACSVPFTTQFSANTQNASTWNWNFGDGTNSTLQNPSHTYTNEGAYTISLTASNAFGCTNTETKPNYINIVKPQINIFRSVASGCIPLSVDFFATINIADPIISYQWNFGDGGTATTAKPQYIFTKQGTFTVTLNITTASGCTASATTIIMAGTLPVVDFSATPLKSCAKDPIQFTNLSTPPGTSWLWIFPQDNSTSTDENPNHQFNQIGSHDVTLQVNNNGCIAQITKKDYIQIIPPIAKFNTVPDCMDPYHRKFTDNSTFGPIPTVIKTWLWDFGEGGATSTLQSPDFHYKTTGIKQVTLIIDNGTCTSTSKQSVNIIDEKPIITADKTSICQGDKINITLGPLNPDNINEYFWDWGDGNTTDLAGFAFNPADGISHQYNQIGTFTIKLTITDKNDCKRDAPPVTITVYGHTADFDFTGKKCKGEEITFTDKSTFNVGNEITKWSWDFGDLSPVVDYSTQPLNTKHIYTNVNTYTVILNTIDKFGCKVKASKDIIFEQVTADFMLPVNIACLDKDFTFVDQSTPNAINYAWNFGDNTTGTGKQPTKIYTTPGNYNVTLKITTAESCTDQVTKTNVVKVPNPKASFTIPGNLDLCPPVKVLFTNTSTDFIKSEWNFGDNGFSAKNDPDEHIYARAKKYDVILTVYSEGGCSSADTLPLTIKGPDGTMNTTPTTGCVPLPVSISATAVKTVSYMWDFDDGTVITSTTPVSPPHTYIQSGIYYPRVSLTDDQGCAVKAVGNDRIIVDKTIADFTVDNAQACGGGVVTFHNNSKTLTKDSLALDFTNAWSFGVPGDPNNIAASFDGSFNYTQPGTSNAKLVVTSAYGCKDEKTLPVIIPPKPQPVIAPILPLCVSGKIQLSGSDAKNLPGTTWLWKVSPDKEFAVQTPPEITLNNVGTIPVELTITNGDGSCPTKATTQIVVNPSPALNPSPVLANICRGAALQLQANTTPNVIVNWTNYKISDNTSQSPQITPNMDTIYQVLATNEFGCTNKGEVRVTVTQPFRIFAQDAEICAGKSTQMLAGGALRYQWIPARGLDRTDVANPIANPDGNITYQVVGYDNGGCFTDTALARVYVRPAPQVNAGPDIVATTGSILPLPVTGSNDITNIVWTPQTGLSCYDCLTPTATPKGNITYHVAVTNQFGCVSSAAVSIKLVCNEGNIFIPNSFSPNGDGQNDVFYIRGKGMQTVRIFRIYNRWGQMVFERAGVNADDPAMGWDGRFKGTPLNPDVFVYYVEVVCDAGAVYVLKGNVTLIR